MLSFFERTFLCAGIPIKFSEGFSPKPRIVNMGALPLGLETYCEIISVELLKPLDISKEGLPKTMKKLSAPFPRGMEIVNIEPLTDKLSKHFPKAMVYSYTADDMDDAQAQNIREQFSVKDLPVVLNHRGQEINLNEHILDLQIQGKTILVKAKCNDQGGTASPFSIYAGLLGKEYDPKKVDDETRKFLIKKIAMDF